MNKKLFALFSILLIAAFALSACGSAAPTGPAELTIWHGYHAGGSEETTINQLASQYMTDHPNVKITVLEVPFDQLFNKYETDTAAGGGPDMFTAPNDNLGSEVRSGVIAPIDDLVKGKLDGYTQAGINGVTVDGKMYAVPGIAKAVGLYYNKSTIATPPATTDDLLNLVKSGKKLGLVAGGGGPYFLWGFWSGFGGKIMDDTGKCVADQGGIADAYTYFKALKDAGATFYNAEGDMDTAFAQGQVDMAVVGPWVLGDYEKGLGDKLGVAPLPAGPGGPSMPMMGIDGWYVNPNSKNQQAAVDFALYAFGKDGLTLYANNAGDPAARSDVAPTDPLVKAFADVAAGGFPRPQSKEFGNYWGPFGDALTAVLAGKATPTDAVATACAAMNKANGK
ncbi:MAG TPA: extracellular solute-binding protein [Anaerolineales bacterium]|jgi:arabinogalactan oligomer/maltooligosaccharide transport system substrate-binding protein|nr:extracellular solute-binding protein [Anaerolineales bacterium]